MRRLRALAATVALKLLSWDGSTAKEIERSQVFLDLSHLTLESMLRDRDTATLLRRYAKVPRQRLAERTQSRERD